MKPQLQPDANCDRCQRPLRLGKGRKDAETFKLAKVPKGVCPDCLITQFLVNTYPINMQIDEAGPELLLKPGIAEAFVACGILEGADLTIEEIDWQRVVANWNLPVKVAKNDPRNPYRMGDSKRRREACKQAGIPEEPYGLFGDRQELPPGMSMSGGALVVDGNALRQSGAKDELSEAMRGLLDAADADSLRLRGKKSRKPN